MKFIKKQSMLQGISFAKMDYRASGKKTYVLATNAHDNERPTPLAIPVGLWRDRSAQRLAPAVDRLKAHPIKEAKEFLWSLASRRFSALAGDYLFPP